MEKVWLEHYQPGVPAEIDPDEYASLADMFEHACEQYAEWPAFTNYGTALSYKNMLDLTATMADYFQNVLHLEKGDRIALIMPNILQYPVAMFAALRAGLIVVNVNPLYTAHEMTHQLRDSGAKAVVVLKNFAAVLAEAIHQYPVEHVIVTEMGDLLPFVKAKLMNFVVKHVKRMVPEWSIANAIEFSDILKQGKPERFKKPALTGADIAFLQYTGGTTGVAKGAILTNRNMLANVAQVEVWIAQALGCDQDIMITALPLYHIFCLLANALTCLKLGVLNYMITNPRDIRGFIKSIKNIKFTSIIGVNTLFNALLHEPSFKEVDFSRLKFSLGGGMPVQQAVAEEWEQLTGVTLIEGYGLTEASPVISIHPLHITHYIESIGLPVSSTDIKIIKDDGSEAGFNEVGELWATGPQIMRGYWQRPEESAKVLKDGWLLTGDMASVDEQGFLRIVERKKDMVLVSGFNVYPNEIEEVIAKIPEVREVAVVGVPSERTGEAVKAFIVSKDDSLTEADVRAYCAKHLARYKIPKIIEFRHDLPKSNVGKILRRALREEVVAEA